MLRIPLPLLLALVLFTTLVTSVAAAPTVPFNVAFYYAEKPPLDELQAFDIVVVDPDASAFNRENTKPAIVSCLPT